MVKIVGTWFVALLLIGSVSTCTDHREVPIAAQRVRLKKVDTPSPRDLEEKVEYFYDQANRVISFLRGDGTNGRIQYDAQDRYKEVKYGYDILDSTKFTQTTFSYDEAGKTMTTFLSSGFRRVYKFDEEGQVISIDTFDERDRQLAGVLFAYENGNVISETYPLGSNRTYARLLYEYDDKPNPLYRIARLDRLDTDHARRLSRNNQVKSTRIDALGQSARTYTYEYKAQGLPTKGGPYSISFEYENY